MLSTTYVPAVLTAALEKGTGIPVMKCSLYKFNSTLIAWALLDQYDILECVLTRERYEIFLAENLLDTGLVDSIVTSGYAVEIERGLIIAGTKYSIVGNLFYISSITYSEQEGRTHLIADLLPTTSVSAIVGTQSAQAVIQDVFDQFNNLSTITFDTNRDIWFNWQFYDTNKEFNLFDGRTLSNVLQQKFFAYLFPRYFHLIYAYGVASNLGNPEDGQYTPFAHAQLTTFLWPDKPVNITWTDEHKIIEEIIVIPQPPGLFSLGFIASADNPSANPTFQEWTRTFNGVCYQFVQRPDLRLEQGDLVTVPTDGHTLTRCFEQIEVYKSRTSLKNKPSKAAWYQIVRQLPYHPQAVVENIPYDWWEPPNLMGGGSAIGGGVTGGIGGDVGGGISGVIDPNLIQLPSLSFLGALNKSASNVQQAFEILDAHNHDAAYAPAAQGVTNGNSHDHAGGDGAQVDHGGLAGLADNDHTQYALTANGVTNGDSHNHAGGDGAQIAYSGLSGLPTVDGWTNPSQTWTYASARTINVPSGAAAIYSKGDKWKVTANGVVLQGYIVAIADTLLTTVGDALTNHTFTNNYYSKAVSPVGFPQYFSLSAPTWTSSGTAFTNQPPTNTFYFSIVGNRLFLNGSATMHSTSGATGLFTATFATGELPTSIVTSVGTVVCADLPYAGFSYIAAGTRAAILAKDDGTTIATNSQTLVLTLTFLI